MVYEKSGNNAHEVVLFMEKCSPGRLTANRIMLCTRNIYLLENMEDVTPEAYNQIITASGSAGIVSENSCRRCKRTRNGKPCRQWINCLRYKRMKKQKKRKNKEYDFWQWYNDNFRADCSGAPDIICNG
ncbi:MAG: hypothetical protein V1854_04835 [Methanobacteriota archaeon]